MGLLSVLNLSPMVVFSIAVTLPTNCSLALQEGRVKKMGDLAVAL